MKESFLSLFRNQQAKQSDPFTSDYVSTAPGIVIGGCGRSGTTLLRVMLDSHRNICCGPESGLFFHPTIDQSDLARKFDLPSAQINELFRLANSRAEFIDLFFQAYCRSVTKPRWAEKTPRNIECIDFIFKSFPQARFLHIIRDGRDVVCSLRTHPRYKVEEGKLIPLNTWDPIAGCIERWRKAIQLARPYWSDSRYLEVRYEKLILNPQSVLEEVMSFVGEPWDENMILYHEQHTAARDITKFPQNPEAIEPLKSDAIGRWQRDMTTEDKDIFKRLAGELLIELGYETNNSWSL